MITLHPLPTGTLRNSRDPLDGAPRCETQWRLSLDANGNVTVYARDFFGGDGTPVDIWEGRALEWGIRRRGDQSAIDAADVATDLADGGKLRTLLERVHAGHDVEWDGSHMAGRLTDDAHAASDDIEGLLNEYRIDDSAPTVWDAYEWLTANGTEKPVTVLRDLGIAGDATEEDITRAVQNAEALAEDESCELVDTREAIRELIADIEK